MTTSEYKAKVIELFKSGKATPSQWEEMASSVLNSSETEYEAVDAIDTEILGSLEECEDCGSFMRSGEGECWGCS